MKYLIVLLIAISLYAGSGSDLFKKCSGCHGPQGNKSALNKSEVIQGWDVNKTVQAINGYKDGTYGKSLKSLMKSQVKNLDDNATLEIAKYINKL